MVDTSHQTPLPPESLKLSLMTLPRGSSWHRVHLDRYGASQFNPGIQGNARFSPIRNAAGEAIPTLYAGATLDCALMETIFHDVPFSAGFKFIDRARLLGQVHSVLKLRKALRLVDLASVPLRKLGISRRQLIDTEKSAYPYTRLWAEAIHRQCPEAQGLCWVSRQDDSARALMLFGDRIAEDAMQVEVQAHPLLDDGPAQDAVLGLADRLGVCIVAGTAGVAPARP